jgi:hypothetical protein
MGNLIPFETFKQRKEKQDAAMEMVKKRKQINLLLGYCKDTINRSKDDDNN